jgi:hypothetical protein
MNEANKVLDLDELFGQARAIKVRWKGEEYEFLRMEGISPRQATQFNQMHLKSAKLQKAMQKGDVNDAQSNQIDELLSQMIKVLCPDFPVSDLGFMAKTQVIQFYMEQTQGKKATKAMLKQLTGASPSHA